MYKVIRKDPVDYDEYDSWVVIAKNPSDARHLCQDYGYNNVRAVEIKIGKKERIILGSYNAG